MVDPLVAEKNSVLEEAQALVQFVNEVEVEALSVFKGLASCVLALALLRDPKKTFDLLDLLIALFCDHLWGILNQDGVELLN